ncbi:MAG: hypothetical protein JHD21_02575 [Nocardioides sp.]|nr:hypothetical protein [Nocardioides sp.]
MREALKLVGVALKTAGVPFALAGSYALWARGAPEPHHDVDFVVAESDRDQAAEILADAGLQVAEPPEDWLFKVYVDDVLVDLLFRLNGDPVTHADLADAEEMEVESVRLPVLGATVLIKAKLAALDERACDLTKVLPAARAVREQVDWDDIAEATADNPFAVVTLDLLARLGVIAPRKGGRQDRSFGV